MPFDVMNFDSLDSTSRFMRRELAQERVGDRPVAVMAARQTDGIGRLGRPWESPEGGLWITVFWPTAPVGADAVIMGVRFGWAVMEAIESVAGPLGDRLTLKWPNDVMLDGQKVAGVLTEVITRQSQRAVLVGIGINANCASHDFPDDLRPFVRTLREGLGRDIDLHALRTALLERVEKTLNTPSPANLTALITPRLHGLGQMVLMTMSDRAKRGVRVLGLADDGRLRVEQDGRESSLIATYE